MALTNMDLKTKNWSHVGEEQTVKRGKERRREEEEEEEKKRKKMEEPKRYGTNFGYEFYYGSYGFCKEF